MAMTLGGLSGTKSNVASDSTQSVTILAANERRKRCFIFNDSTATLYLDMTGGTASSSSMTVAVAPGQYASENPDSYSGKLYKGLITGRWSATNGSARVTEWV